MFIIAIDIWCRLEAIAYRCIHSVSLLPIVAGSSTGRNNLRRHAKMRACQIANILMHQQEKDCVQTLVK